MVNKNALNSPQSLNLIMLQAMIEGEQAYTPERKGMDALIKTMENAAVSGNPNQWLAALCFAAGFLSESRQVQSKLRH